MKLNAIMVVIGICYLFYVYTVAKEDKVSFCLALIKDVLIKTLVIGGFILWFRILFILTPYNGIVAVVVGTVSAIVMMYPLMFIRTSIEKITYPDTKEK